MFGGVSQSPAKGFLYAGDLWICPGTTPITPLRTLKLSMARVGPSIGGLDSYLELQNDPRFWSANQFPASRLVGTSSPEGKRRHTRRASLLVAQTRPGVPCLDHVLVFAPSAPSALERKEKPTQKSSTWEGLPIYTSGKHICFNGTIYRIYQYPSQTYCYPHLPDILASHVTSD